MMKDPFSVLRGDEYLASLIEAKVVKSSSFLCCVDLMRNMYISKSTLRQAILSDIKISSSNRYPKSFFLTKEMRLKHQKTIHHYVSIGVSFRTKLHKVKRT